MPPLPSWTATAPAGRVLLAGAAVAAVLAAGSLSAALRTRPTVVRSVVVADAPPVRALDAAGCPSGVRCAFRPSLPAGVQAALDRHFPHAVAQWRSSTLDAATGTVYQARAAVQPGPGAALLLTARCLPGGTEREPARDQTSAQQRSDLAGNQLALVTRHSRQVAGAPGCAVTVELTAPGLGSGYTAALAALTADPEAQLRP